MDEIFMREALEEAEIAFSEDEVPIGAVLVYEGKIIARAHNQTEMLRDATAHAEVLCIRKASLILQNWRLTDTILYSTLEPCSMCLGAMLLARIGTLVWGAEDIRHGAQGSWTNLLDLPHPTHTLNVRKGVLAAASSALLKSFFRKRRLEVTHVGNGI